MKDNTTLTTKDGKNSPFVLTDLKHKFDGLVSLDGRFRDGGIAPQDEKTQYPVEEETGDNLEDIAEELYKQLHSEQETQAKGGKVLLYAALGLAVYSIIK